MREKTLKFGNVNKKEFHTSKEYISLKKKYRKNSDI